MTTATRSFDTAESPVSEGGSWTSGPGASGDMLVSSSGALRVSSSGVNSIARYEASSFLSDHSSEVTVATAAANVTLGPVVRCQSSTDPSCYCAYAFSSMSNVQLARIDASMGFTNIGSALFGVNLTVGSKLKLAIVGSTLTVYKDGVSQGTRTDGTLSGGQPGCMGFASAGGETNDLITAWTGADAGLANARAPFDGTENPVSEGGSWTSGPGDAGDFLKVAGMLRVVVASDMDSLGRYEAVAFSADHESEVITAVAASSGTNLGPAVRLQTPTDPSCYVAFNTDATTIYIIRLDAFVSYHQLLPAVTGLSLPSGTRVRLRAVGSTLTLYVDDLLVATRTDATLTGGLPGVYLWANDDTVDIISAWRASDVFAGLTIGPTGIASGEAFGTPTVEPELATIQPTGIPSAEAFGTLVLSAVVAPAGIASAEAFGVPSLALVVQPQGIPSAEAFGVPFLGDGSALTIDLAGHGIPSAEAFGVPSVSPVVPAEWIDATIAELPRIEAAVETAPGCFEATIERRSG